ncbi:dihydroorotase [Leptolyngbya sp. 'hensonii']|uniref:dihydroorotase n=1 Tax=Leptolyngbya sp. 'hensonii' TaxID=1922337 RepID=UPI0009501495|nr:dihydroorotase [Leptolyngbya sp. 'hensonii']OLP18755.1 dihydroorotase [Leptolyngbya sp. 'hensonii']
MVSELLQQVRLLDPVSETDRIADVLIKDNRIEAIETTRSPLADTIQVRDCQGLILGPGLVDLYSHSGEPGFESRETLSSLKQAAIAGGFTRVAILPDTTPPIDQPGAILSLQHQTQKPDSGPEPHLHYWGALTLGLEGKQMTELTELAAAGIVGFTDGRPWSSLVLLRRLLEYLQPLQKPIALWPCGLELAGNGVMREGPDSIRFGLPGNPALAETSALAALLEAVAETGTAVHIMRISTARSVALIQAARSSGLPVTASTTWMHLLYNTQAIESYNPNLRLEPPLGSPADQKALQQGLRQGILDGIAIDHTPYTYEEKTVAFAEAPPGAIGLELALPQLWQALVETGTWTALELWAALSTGPARCLGQLAPAIVPGQPAELVLFDPQQTWLLEQKKLRSRSHNTPLLGQTLTGRVLQVWCP